MAHRLSRALGVAALALATGAASHALAQSWTGTANWEQYAGPAISQSLAALASTPASIEATNNSPESTRDLCSVMARGLWTMPDTGASLNVGLGFHGHCSATAPTGALAVHVGMSDQASSTGRILFSWTIDSSRLGIGPVAVLGTSVPERLVETRSQLNAMAASRLISSSALPPWPAGATVPSLPLGVSWAGGVERELYEAIRARNTPVICLFNDTMLCGAYVPERGNRVVEVLVVQGLGGPYRLRQQADALDALTGARPPITQQELATWEADQDAIMQRLSEAVARNAN